MTLTTEGNKVIFESNFLETDWNGVVMSDKFYQECDFHKNWNSIMPVVAKIRKDAYDRQDIRYWAIVAAALYTCEIERIFNAVIIYINKTKTI